MIAMLSGVFAASLLGSLHCAGMCGPLAVVASSPVQLTANGRSLRVSVPHAAPQGPSIASRLRALTSDGSLRLSAIYHLARLSTYATLGAIAGAIGHAVDLGGSAMGLQRVASVLAAGTLLVMGVVMLARHLGVRLAVVNTPPTISTALRKLHAWASRLAPAARAGIIGLATTLLPCGWLYAFVISAAATAHPLSGTLVMAAFWAGTVPMLTFVGVGAHRMLRPLRERLPGLAAVLLISVGTASLFWRVSPVFAARVPDSAEPSRPACPLCEMSGHAPKPAP